MHTELSCPSGVRQAFAVADLRHVRCKRVLGFSHRAIRPKLIGRNSRKDVHGWHTQENVIRIETDQGIGGIGFGNVSQDQARGVVNRPLSDFWSETEGVVSPLGRADHALYDLIGKALGRPSWQFFGAAGPEWVPVYDTGFYFSDLLPDYVHLGEARLVEELETSLRAGHRSFKVKVGRGAKWMEPCQGLQRDIAVIRALRCAGGREIRLLADANNVFTIDEAKQFLDAVGHELFLAEELFPEDVEACRGLRRWLKDRSMATLLADGETEHDPDVHLMLAREGALDVLQPDIRALGLSLQWRLSRQVSDIPGVWIASHNWGSYLGTFKMLTLARGIRNFLIAEVDTAASDLFDHSDWALKEGRMKVPSPPGCGLTVDECIYREKYLPAAWVVD